MARPTRRELIEKIHELKTINEELYEKLDDICDIACPCDEEEGQEETKPEAKPE